MTIATPPTRIEQSSPLLAEIRSGSAKSITGAIVATYQGVEVSVWIEEGALVAVHSPSYRPPAKELVERLSGRTSTDLADPLGEAYRAGWLTADQVDAAVCDYAYGLLASALTWRKPKIRRRPKARVEHDRLLPGRQVPWQVAVTDVTARVDELVSSWAVITEALAAARMDPRPASHACSRLVAKVESHPLLSTGLPVDAAARALGTTRQVLLSEIARAILRGQMPTFEVVPVAVGSSPGEGVLVPEELEAAESQWATVEATARVNTAGVSLPDRAAPQPGTTDPLGFLAETHPADPFSAAVMDVAEVWPAREDEAGPESELQDVDPPSMPDLAIEPQADPEPTWSFEQAATQDDGQEFEEPIVELDDEPDYDLAVETQPLAPDEPESPAPAINPLDEWVAGAGDEQERALRAEVVATAARAAVSIASQKVQAAEQALAEVSRCAQALVGAIRQVPLLQSALDAAEAAADEADSKVSAARAAAGDVFERCRLAEQRAQVAAGARDAAMLAAEDARTAYERAVERARDLSAASDEAARAAVNARRNLETSEGAAVAAATAQYERLLAEQVDPARQALERALEERSAADSALARAHEQLNRTGFAAGHAVAMLVSGWPVQPDGSEMAAARMQALEKAAGEQLVWLQDVLSAKDADPMPAHAAPAQPVDLPAQEAAPAEHDDRPPELDDDDLRSLDVLAATYDPVVPTPSPSAETWQGNDAEQAPSSYTGV